jgi:glyoxylase-like metal-dependent hydrolase (beta-lactamase superfamily II)
MWKRYLLFWMAVLFTCWVSCAEGQTRVPRWDAKGVGLLPGQGITSLDVSADGTIVVGTIAPAGQPNVFELDSAGKLISRHEAGQRWIGEVAAVAKGRHYALCTTPAGRAEDVPTVFSCGESVVAVPSQLGQAAYPRTVFHYGDHSNHTGTHVARFDHGAVALYGSRLLWMEQPGSNPAAAATIRPPEESVTVSLAVHRSGAAVAGYAVSPNANGDPSDNLFLFARNEPQSSWSRPMLAEVADSVRPEMGRYGTPTLPDGKRDELPQQDLPVFAPLSIAVDGEPQLTRIATADYRGFQRWIRSSATGEEQNYGTRFVPARPTITIYDAQGKTVQRFGSAKFNKSMWVDLAFLPGAKQLLAYSHHWTCRGLAGQTILPADDDARTLFLLDVETGNVRSLDLPDAICDVAVGSDGTIAATCWDGRLYLLTPDEFPANQLPAGIEVGGPALVATHPKSGFVLATTSGAVRVVNAAGKSVSQLELNKAVEPTTPKWISNAKAERIADGLWQLPGGRVESDLGGQRLIEAPDGLILIEAHAGLSFEREWAAIEAAGLDPRRVRYVLATHEHGDHAPGAYLWRVATGAEFVCSEEMAYTLQHHIPLSTGYGLHPPIPTDVKISQDKLLDLAGLKVAAVRLPGHTFGSMGWLFTAEKKRYIAIGDLIMPDGALGYAGSINFSASDVLASLRKLDSLRVDTILPGHGPITGPDRYIAAGIGVGRHVGWGKIRPEAPNPRYRLTQENVMVVGWNLGATSADIGDLNSDGRPDVAVVAPTNDGSTISVFLNHNGKFRERADHVIAAPGVTKPSKLRVRNLNDDGVPDFFVGGQQSVLLLSKKKFPEYEVVTIGMAEGNQARLCDIDGDGRRDIIANAKFGTFARVVQRKDGNATMQAFQPTLNGPYADVLPLDLNDDGREDLVSSYGHISLRDGKGTLPNEPSFKLPISSERDWSCLGIGDFNGDGRPDITLSSYGQGPVKSTVFYNTGQTDRPFDKLPNATLDLNTLTGNKQIKGPLLRDSIPAADFNSDGIDDLIVAKGQDQRILILLGSRDGLSLKKSLAFDLDYRLHYETGLFVADFNGDGKLDIGSLGNTKTGVGAGGPLAVYVYLQMPP